VLFEFGLLNTIFSFYFTVIEESVIEIIKQLQGNPNSFFIFLAVVDDHGGFILGFGEMTEEREPWNESG
jgi:hypothetical protein